MEKDYDEEALKEILSRAPMTSRLFETWKKRTMWSGEKQTEAFMEFCNYVESKNSLLASSIILEFNEATEKYYLEKAVETRILIIALELLSKKLEKAI